MLGQGQCDTDNVLQEIAVTQLAQIVDDFFRQVRVLLLLIRGEQTGNWYLHLYAVSEMIPILHDAAHLAYAKSARHYLDTMKKILEIMTEAQCRTFTEDGYFKIRRKNTCVFFFLGGG